MKTLLLSCTICVLFYNCSSTKTQSTTIGVTTSIVSPLSLQQVAGDKNNQAIYVRDSIYGGLFTYSTTGVADNAITFKSADGKYWRRLMDDHIYPEWFGASGDGKTDDGPAFQGMMDWIADQDSRAWKIGFKNRKYLINTTVKWPSAIKATNGVSSQLIEMNGYGVTITTNNAKTIFSRMPANQDEASSIISGYRFSLKGISFKGTQANGQTALQMHSFYSSEIKDCNFSNFDTAIVCAFWLKGMFSNLMFTNNLSAALVGRTGTGIWTDGALSNSAFNANIISDCRIYNNTGSFASIMLLGADGNTIRNTISEGASPKYNFYVDYQGSTTVNMTTFDNLWVESSGGTNVHGTNFFFRTKGTTVVRNLNRTLQDTLFYIDPNGAPGQTIIFDNIPYVSNMAPKPFKAGASQLSGIGILFKNMPVGLETTIFDTANWEGGVLPRVLAMENTRSANGGYIISSTSDITINPGYNTKGSTTSNISLLWNGVLQPGYDNTYGIGGRYTTPNNRPIIYWSGTSGYFADTAARFGFSSTNADKADVYLERPEANILSIHASGATQLSNGGSALRPAKPLAGYIRYNTDSAWFEGYDGSAWKMLGKGPGGVGASGGSSGGIREYTVQTKEARKEIMIASLPLEKDKLTRYKLSFLANGASDNDAANFESIVLVRTVGTNGTLIGKLTQLMSPILSGSFDGSNVRADVSGNYLSIFVNPGSYGRQANWIVRVDKLSR